MEVILQLLDELEEIVENGKAAPFRNRVSIDKNEVYEWIGEFRSKLPNELKQAQWILEDRNKIILDAQKEADQVLQKAEDEMKRLIDENEITKQAYEQAALIIESAKKTAKEMRLGAVEYAEEILAGTEERLKELKAVVYSESMKTDDYFGQTLNILAENIQELRMSK